MLKSATTAAVTAALLALWGCERAAPEAATAAAAPQHPDFSGLYFPAGRQQDPQQPQYTPAAQAAAEKLVRDSRDAAVKLLRKEEAA